MKLTAHQQSKADEVLDITRNKNRVLLKGSAGVGKTYLANYLIRELSRRIPRQNKIYVSAPTNKAVSVIRDKVTPMDNLEFVTTHSALKMKRNINNKTGEVTFKSYANEKYPPLKDVKLLVIDEASMINSVMLKYIEQYASEQGCTVLFIGDHKQLNPVGEDDSPVFLAGYPTVELTEIIRQGEGNPIIDLSRDLQSIWAKEPKRTEQGGYIYTMDQSRIVSTLAAANGTDELKYLAWTNAEVDRMNKLVRHCLYGANPKLVELGESLIFDAPYGTNSHGASVYFTNEEMLVENIELKTVKFMYPVKSNNITGEYELNPIHLKVYCVNPGEKELQNGVVIVHEDSIPDFKKIQTEMRSNCLAKVLEWVDFFQFIEQFAQVKYNHAITTHKSQGSTYKQVIINVRDLNRNRKKEEKQRLFYTAVTRASDLVILYNV